MHPPSNILQHAPSTGFYYLQDPTRRQNAAYYPQPCPSIRPFPPPPLVPPPLGPLPTHHPRSMANGMTSFRLPPIDTSHATQFAAPQSTSTHSNNWPQYAQHPAQQHYVAPTVNMTDGAGPGPSHPLPSKSPVVDKMEISASSTDERSSSLSTLHSVTPEITPDQQKFGFTPINGPDSCEPFSALTEVATPTAKHPVNKRKSAVGAAIGSGQPWTDDETHLLKQWAPYVKTHTITWDYVATRIKSHSAGECQQRWKQISPQTKKGQPTAEHFEVQVKLEEVVEITDDMLPPKKLTAEQHDCLMEAGYRKYREPDFPWRSVAGLDLMRSYLKITGQDTITDGMVANICNLWGRLFIAKVNQGIDGVIILGSSPAALNTNEPMHRLTPAPTTLAEYNLLPPDLKKRMDAPVDRSQSKAAGSASLSARFFAQFDNGNAEKRSAVTSRVEVADPDTIITAPVTETGPQSGSERTTVTVLKLPRLSTALSGIHVDFKDVRAPGTECDNCSKVSLLVKECLACGHSFCVPCLEVGEMLTHQLPKNREHALQPDLQPITSHGGRPNVQNAVQTQEDAGQADVQKVTDTTSFEELQRMEQEFNSPGRIMRERAAKTKAQEQNKYALAEFGDFQAQPDKSPIMRPAAKSPRLNDRQSSQKQAIDTAPSPTTRPSSKRQIMESEGPGKRQKLILEARSSRSEDQPKKKQRLSTRARNTTERNVAKPVTDAFQDGGSSSGFEEDELEPKRPTSAQRPKTRNVRSPPVIKSNNAARKKASPGFIPTSSEPITGSKKDRLVNRRKHIKTAIGRASLAGRSEDLGFETDDEGLSRSQRARTSSRRATEPTSNNEDAMDISAHSAEEVNSLAMSADRYGVQELTKDPTSALSKVRSIERASNSPTTGSIRTHTSDDRTAAHQNFSPRLGARNQDSSTRKSSYSREGLSASNTPMSLTNAAHMQDSDSDIDSDDDSSDSEVIAHRAQLEAARQRLAAAMKLAEEEEQMKREEEDRRQRKKEKRRLKHEAMIKQLEEQAQIIEDGALQSREQREREKKARKSSTYGSRPAQSPMEG